MRILLLGSGGREHALAWKLSQSDRCYALFIAPGNAGTLEFGKNVALNMLDFDALLTFCLEEKIEMVVVGPEEPLVNGIVDFFQSTDIGRHIAVIGPTRAGAQLEGSKSFAKSFMKRHQIPTAAYGEFNSNNYQEGIDYMRHHELPIVLKADGLASGKGVLICKNLVEAMAEFELMIQKSKFGEAGRKVVIEEFLDGIELSVFVLTDGRSYLVLPEAKDYKRIGEGDTGLNTGGMGAISPVPFADETFMKKVEERIVQPTIKGLIDEEIPYTGIIFLGLIKVGDDPYVIEYNCRLGDPETEVVIPRLKNDLVELFQAAYQQRLHEATIQTETLAACTIVAVSGGYPGDFKKGFEIEGMPEHPAVNSLIFHAATLKKNSKVLTNGGRVLCVTSYGESISEAAIRSKKVLSSIYFSDMYYRKDIGFEFI